MKQSVCWLHEFDCIHSAFFSTGMPDFKYKNEFVTKIAE